MQTCREKDNEELKQWMKDSGCLIHPAIQIPAYFDGIQGVGTSEDLPHKTVILAIPSKLVITVPNCYDDPALKSLFHSSDQLFDYEADEDAQFNILCVFLMYQKIHIERSPWKAYLNTIAEPETAISWADKQLVGLNKSMIQQIVHVRKQCKKMQQKLCSFLVKTKQFKHLSKNEIVNLFKIYYPTVLTRCFGYYFSTACIIPIADLMNHSCQSIDHQLIHLNFEKESQFDQTYTLKKHKLNCSLLGLPKPDKQSMPFRLDFLLKNNLIENSTKNLGEINREQIDQKIYGFLSERMKDDPSCQVEMLDFCEENDEQDNDTDEEEQNQRSKSLVHIRSVEKQQKELYQQYTVEVNKLGDVEKKIELQHKKQQQQKMKAEAEKQKLQKQQKQKQTNQNSADFQPNSNQQCNTNSKPKDELLTQNQSDTSPKSDIFSDNMGICPIYHTKDSPSQSQYSQQQQWCLDKQCYFTMSTHCPISAGSQLYNSYGSRSNKFLLVWYGFTYRNNLYDSVTLRLQVNFPKEKPQAKDIVLDTYVGGQGLCFKKNQYEQVKPEEVSRQFKLKRHHLPTQLLIFLRLFLTHYYTGMDNYKILCTIPSSLQFEKQLLQYLKNIIEYIYQWYPLVLLEKLRQMVLDEKDISKRNKILFKIIYIEEQRKILEENIQAVEHAMIVISRLKKLKEFKKEVYSDFKISTIRKIRQYLIELKNNFHYIMYTQIITKTNQPHQTNIII